jgi:hypothetical protein
MLQRRGQAGGVVLYIWPHLDGQLSSSSVSELDLLLETCSQPETHISGINFALRKFELVSRDQKFLRKRRVPVSAPHNVKRDDSSVCLTTAPWHLPKRILHRVRDVASTFSLQYPVLSLRPYSSCLCLLPRLHVTSSLLPLLQ